MNEYDDHNKLCDMLTRIVMAALPPADRKDPERIKRMTEFVFKRTELPLELAALITYGQR